MVSKAIMRKGSGPPASATCVTFLQAFPPCAVTLFVHCYALWWLWRLLRLACDDMIRIRELLHTSLVRELVALSARFE